MGEHEDRIGAAFSKQAGTFEDSTLNSAFTSSLPWFVGLAGPLPGDRVLDVAGGTGLVARGLAPDVAHVTVVDTTPAMLDTGRSASAAERHANVEFVEADAMSLPFGDGSFSLAVTRFSLHHLVDPRSVLREMLRVVAPGGRVAVMDLVSDPDPDVARRQDEVERLRDDSHVAMPVEGAVKVWLGDAGCRVLTAERRPVDRPLEPWLGQSVTPPGDRERVREALRRDLDGGPATGMRPYVRDGELWFHQTWETTVARR
ncbi:MAG: class I SAM-dependent methyltransferase, partial [Nocardioidaceae bacterium]